MQVGVDTGGTFTDLVAADGRVAKVLSTPDDLSHIRAAVGGTACELLAHGTTVATNALLERRGATVALVTTEGAAHVIEIGRQDRPSLYDHLRRGRSPWSTAPCATRSRAAGGRRPEPGTGHVASLPAIDDGAGVVAVPAARRHRACARAGGRPELVGRGHDVTCSHEVSPEMREVERMVTTVINAALRPRCRDYLRGIGDVADEVLVMTSSGAAAGRRGGRAASGPAAVGPAGGVRAGAAAMLANGLPTPSPSTWGAHRPTCLIVDGVPAPAAQRQVAGFTVRFPSLDVHSIGAGGLIAWIDPGGGALVVGPQSGAPTWARPATAGGGAQPTVTDANLAAGATPPRRAWGLALDRSAAHAALERAGVTAEGVLAVVDANMERALRAVSIERGVDPGGLALVAFGGAGPLHACALAEALGMPAVVVPGRRRAVGRGPADRPSPARPVWSWPADDHRGLVPALAALADRGSPWSPATTGRRPACGRTRSCAGDAEVTTALDCRYRGQSHELTVASVAAFHDEHGRRNGYARPEDTASRWWRSGRPPSAHRRPRPRTCRPPERAVPAPWPARPPWPSPTARWGGTGVGRRPGVAGAGAAQDGGTVTGGARSGQADGTEAQRRHGEHRTDEAQHERAGLAQRPVELPLDLREPGVHCWNRAPTCSKCRSTMANSGVGPRLGVGELGLRCPPRVASWPYVDARLELREPAVDARPTPGKRVSCPSPRAPMRSRPAPRAGAGRPGGHCRPSRRAQQGHQAVGSSLPSSSSKARYSLQGTFVEHGVSCLAPLAIGGAGTLGEDDGGVEPAAPVLDGVGGRRPGCDGHGGGA